MYTLQNFSYDPINFTPSQVGIALKVKMLSEAPKNLARAAGVNESSLSRAMAGKPSKKIAAFLGFEKAAK